MLGQRWFIYNIRLRRLIFVWTLNNKEKVAWSSVSLKKHTLEQNKKFKANVLNVTKTKNNTFSSLQIIIKMIHEDFFGSNILFTRFKTINWFWEFFGFVEINYYYYYENSQIFTWCCRGKHSWIMFLQISNKLNKKSYPQRG